MTEPQWREVWKLYEAACALPLAEQRTFVQGSPDPEIAQQVLKLLTDLADPASMDRSAWPSASDAEAETGAEEAA